MSHHLYDKILGPMDGKLIPVHMEQIFNKSNAIYSIAQIVFCKIIFLPTECLWEFFLHYTKWNFLADGV